MCIAVRIIPLGRPVSFCNSSTAQKSRHGEKVSFVHPSNWTLGILIFGALLDVLSIFTPWIATSDKYESLPWSSNLILVTVVVRAATILAWLGILLYIYVKRSYVSYALLLLSSVLSFIAFGIFAYVGASLLWGAYLGLGGGILVVFGVVAEKLDLEIILESEEDVPQGRS